MAQGLSASALGGRAPRDASWLASPLLIAFAQSWGQGGAADHEALHVLGDMVRIWSGDLPCLAKVHVRHKLNKLTVGWFLTFTA